MNQIKTLALIIVTTFFLASCSTLMLSPAEFGWPIESVLKVDDNGIVKEDRYSLSFNTKPLFFEETQDSMSFAGKSIHLIRNVEGYYFMTSANFKNIYVFTVEKNAFALKDKFLIIEAGLKNPALNQRPPFIELIDDGNTYKLTSEGIEGETK